MDYFTKFNRSVLIIVSLLNNFNLSFHLEFKKMLIKVVINGFIDLMKFVLGLFIG